MSAINVRSVNVALVETFRISEKVGIGVNPEIIKLNDIFLCSKYIFKCVLLEIGP